MKLPTRIGLQSLLFSLSTAVLAVTAQAEPFIFNITKTARPGDVIAIQGSGFGTSPSVTVSDGTNSGALTLANGGILNADGGTNISVVTPSNVAAGKILTVTVTNGTSDFAQVNVPEIWSYLDLAGLQVAPNTQFRIYGDNLWAPGLTTSVWLKHGTTFYACPLVGTPTDRFIIKVQAPANLPTSGTLTVHVRAGGVTTGNGVAGAQTLTARSGGTDVWGLGVPWGADYAPFFSTIYNVKNPPYNATGNGTTNDAPAIQSAINAATANGGTVYLPAGTYNVGTSVISVKSNVVLKGDGMDQTTILANSSSAGVRTVSMDGNLVGLADLRIFVAAGVGTGALPGRECTYSSARTKLFALRCKFDQYKPAAVNNVGAFAIRWDNANQLVIKGCVTYMDAKKHDYGNVVLQNGKDILFAGNNLTYRDSRIWLDESNRVQYENNVANRCNDRIRHSMVVAQNSGGIRFANTFNLAALGNTFQWQDAAGNGQPAVIDSDGESIMTEGPSEAWGTATGGTGTTLSGAFGVAPTTFGNLTSTPHFIMLTRGVGAGQLRAITANTSSQITVSPAWDVAPVSGTGFVVLRKTTENILVRGNTVEALRFGFMLSSANAFNVNVVGNTFRDTTSIAIRTFQVNTGKQTHTVTKDLVIEGNNCVDTGKWRTSYPADWYPSTITFEVNGAIGDDLWNTTVYGNSVQAYALANNAPWDVGGQPTGEGYVAVQHTNGSGDPNTGAVQGLTFDRNTATNCNTAYYLAPSLINTTIWNSHLVNCAKTWKAWVDAPDLVAYGPYVSSGNLLLNKPCAVSSIFSHDSFPGRFALDANTATSWGSKTGGSASVPEWILVDLGSSRNINRVKLTWDSAFYGRDYTIQASPNGFDSWSTLRTVSANTAAVNDLTGLTGVCRYLLVNVTAPATGKTKLNLKELEAYAPAASPVLLSQGKPASASSALSGLEASKGNDGSGSSRWGGTSFVYPQWWSVDMQSTYTLSQVTINWAGPSTVVWKYKIEASPDNSTFTTVVDKTGNTVAGNATTDNLPGGTTARYLRVTVTGGDNQVSFYECKVYGN